MAEKEKAAVAVETTATVAQEASPASIINDTTKELIHQIVWNYRKLLSMETALNKTTDGKVRFRLNGCTVEGVEVIQEVLGGEVNKYYDVEYEDGHTLRHLMFGEDWFDGEIYGGLSNGTETI